VLRELDSGPDTGVLNSDTIILLHVPPDGGAAVAFSIPRDTYVDIPGHRRDKINAAYPAVTALTAQRLVDDGLLRAQADAEAARAGRAALIGAVEGLTGVSVDHYAEINLLGFHDLTRVIGGVEVCLTRAVDEPLSGARLPAGPQTISGRDALAFVRQRQGLPDGDLSRIRRQQVFLAAVAERVLSAGTLTDPAALAGLVDAVQRSVVSTRAGTCSRRPARRRPRRRGPGVRHDPHDRPGEQRPRGRPARRPAGRRGLRGAAHRRPARRRGGGRGARRRPPGRRRWST
jgi:LCP family protein required for cell wall assembly